MNSYTCIFLPEMDRLLGPMWGTDKQMYMLPDTIKADTIPTHVLRKTHLVKLGSLR